MGVVDGSVMAVMAVAHGRTCAVCRPRSVRRCVVCGGASDGDQKGRNPDEMNSGSGRGLVNEAAGTQ
jgi:hypothetical protein